MNKKPSLFIVCIALLSITMHGCEQSPTARPTATVKATLRIDPTPSPTPTSTNTPTPLPSPTTTAAPPATLTPTPTDAPEPDESRQSGIQGQVLMGPMCAGPIRADDSCPDEPFSATFYVLDSQGSQVACFRTGEDGYFRILLAPGEYKIVPDKSAPLMSPASQKKSVTVPDQEMMSVTLLFDTGIR